MTYDDWKLSTPEDEAVPEPELCYVCQEFDATAQCDKTDADGDRCRTLLCGDRSCRTRHEKLCHASDLSEEVWS